MKRILSLCALTLAFAAPAQAAVYLTGSVAGSTSNIEYQTYQSQYARASLAVDLGHYLRLSYSYSLENSNNNGYTDPRTDDELKSANATRANANNDPTDDNNLVAYSTRSHVVGNSVDLQVVLYEGDIFIPYIMGGVIYKTTTVVTEQDGKDPQVSQGGGLGPNLGAGLGIRLNRAFTLKLSYIASPGATRQPGDAEKKKVWDKKVTLGLSYQL